LTPPPFGADASVRVTTPPKPSLTRTVGAAEAVYVLVGVGPEVSNVPSPSRSQS